MTNPAHILVRVNFALSGGMNIAESNTGYEPNSEFDMAGRFVPMVDLTRDDEDSNSHISDIPLHLVASDNSAWVTFSQAEGDLMRNVPSLHLVPTQTGVGFTSSS